MSVADQNQEEQSLVIEGPGKQLREIRMAKELDINRVAGLLHLNVSLLKTLEADDFSNLPGTVFVQGYLKNYARLLETPVQPILDALRQFRPEAEEKMDLKAAQVKHEVRSSHTIVRLFTWLIVIGILALVVTWWRGYLQWPIDLGLEPDGSSVSEPQQEEILQNGLQPGEMSGSISLPALLGKPEILDAPVTEATDSTETTASELVNSESPSTEVPTEGVTSERPMSSAVTESTQGSVEVPASSEVAEAEVSTVSPSESGVTPEHAVEVSFSDACWADIKDATGDFRLAGNRAAGERYLLGGEPPYKMVFGNATAVKLSINGVAYDLAPYTRGNVVRITLDPR